MKALPHIHSLSVVLVFFLITPTASAAESSCHVLEHTVTWQRLLERYPDDDELRDLFRLRLQLCQEVERGSIPVDQATERFERARERLMQKWREQNEQRSEESVSKA